jgi:MFS family permease
VGDTGGELCGSGTLTQSRPPASSKRVAAATFIGTTAEFYDFFVYGTAAALVFPKTFFPGASSATGVLLSFATFGVGFLARPLGGVVFGHFGDRIGRKPMLVYSLLGMGLSTVLIGLLPTYGQIGVTAPILLTMLRVFQGFAVGGEWGGATLMAVEHAPDSRRGLYGAFPQMGAPAGTATATLAFFAVSGLPDEQFISWGWRIPFLLSAVLLIVGLAVRVTLSESPDFVAVRARSGVARMPVMLAFRKHGKQIILVAGAYLSQGVFAYICVAYLVTYGTSVAGIDRSWTLFGVFIGSVVGVVLYPLFGALSDRFERKPLFLAGIVAMGAAIAPMFALINTGKSALFLVALVLAFIALAPAAGVTGSLFSMAFDADVRYSGVSLGYTLSQVLGAAFAPIIAAALYTATHTSGSIVAYLIAMSVVSAVSVSLLPGTWRRPAIKRAPLRVSPPALDREDI